MGRHRGRIIALRYRTRQISEFQIFQNKKTLAINGIIEINEKQLLLYTNQNENLLTFDTEAHYFSDNPLHPSLLNILPTAIAKQDNHIYIGSYKGVFSYSISDKTLKSIMPDKLKGKQILSILQQSPILLWIGTEGHGLYKVNLQTQEITNYVNNPKNPNSISSNYIRSLTLDPQNRLWIGTLNSLSIYDESMIHLITIPAT